MTEPAAPQAGPATGGAVLLHGLGGRSSVWDAVTAALPAVTPTPHPNPTPWRSVSLPWRSLGDTEWCRTGDPGRVVADAVGPPDGFGRAVIAHSYAANLLLEEYAAGRVAPRPTVLVSPFYRARPEHFDWATISYYLNEFHQTFLEALRLGETGRFPAARRAWMAGRLRDHVGPYGWMRFFDTYLHTPFLDLAAVRAPVLIVTGDADIAAQPADGRALADALPDARFVPLDGCGHFPMVERPADVARLVADFLAGTTPPPGTPRPASVPTTATPWS